MAEKLFTHWFEYRELVRGDTDTKHGRSRRYCSVKVPLVLSTSGSIGSSMNRSKDDILRCWYNKLVMIKVTAGISDDLRFTG